jgi:alpha-beta hydrolase superfamily lysophospholipase
MTQDVSSQRSLQTTRRRRLPFFALFALAAATLVGGCTSSAGSTSSNRTTTGTKDSPKILPIAHWSRATSALIGSFWNPPSPLHDAAAGTLIRAEQVVGVPGVPSGATLWRILYHSRDVAGGDIAVSGYAVVPSSAAPKGGRAIVTWAHGTTGTARICAPSLFSPSTASTYFPPGFSSLLTDGIYLTPNLGGLLAAGYVVAATDYEGLGAPGVSPYLVGLPAAQSVLDAARAARQLPGSHTSNKVVILGHSEGGQAALFAGQIAKTYAPDLDVAGTVAIAPPTDTKALLPLAVELKQLRPVVALAGYSWAHTYPDLPMRALFTPAAINTVSKLATTDCEGAFARQLISSSVAAHLFQPGFVKGAAFLRALNANTPGEVHTPGPVLILQGTADTTVPDGLAQAFESTQCPLVHDNLELRLYTGATHASILVESAPYLLSWIADRVAGAPAGTGCSTVTKN